MITSPDGDIMDKLYIEASHEVKLVLLRVTVGRWNMHADMWLWVFIV